MSSDDEQPTAAPPAAPPARPHPPPPPPTRRHSVRFSTELPRAIPEALDIDSASRLEFPPSLDDPPVSPRNRNRGYSLRRQLFFRHASVTDDDGRSTARTNSSDTVELGRLTTSPSPPEMRKEGADDTDDEDLVHYHPRSMRATGLRRWWKELGVKERYEYTRKTIFREHEIPPSKDGRKIPLRAHYEVPLIDERTGGHYVNNTVCCDGCREEWEGGLMRSRFGAGDIRCGISCRSSCFISFRNWRICRWRARDAGVMWDRDADPGNSYFLCVSVLQMIPSKLVVVSAFHCA